MISGLPTLRFRIGPFPVQIDGDYIGEFERVELGVKPGGLLAVS